MPEIQGYPLPVSFIIGIANHEVKSIELMAVMKGTFLLYVFKFDGSGIKFKENSVGKQETYPEFPRSGYWGWFFVVFWCIIYRALSKTAPPLLLSGPGYSGCCCIFKFANQVQLLKLLFCYIF